MPRPSPDRLVVLGAAPTFHLPDLSGLTEGVTAAPAREARLETTYFDTSDHRLARWGISLQHRGERWTLALPDARDTMAELAFDGGGKRPPEAALALVRAYTRGLPVEPMARLSTWCRRVSLADSGGQTLAEVADDEVSVLDGRRVAARFREVEVDVRPGAEGLLQPLLARLREAGAGTPDPLPKHLRAMGPAAQAGPDVAVTALPPDPTAADVIRAALAASVQLVLRHDPLVRLGGDPEHVHQARVGTRRLRSHLRTFRPLLDQAWSDGLREELGWIAGELGAVRDGEVLHERLLVLIAGLPAADVRPAAGLAATLAGQVAADRETLLAAMSTPRYYELLDRLVESAARPVLLEEAELPASQVLPGIVRPPWRKLVRAVRALGEEPPDEELHQVRILAKRVRYAAEAVAPAVGPHAARFGRLAAGLQTVLGDHQDSVTMQTWLRGAAGGGRRRAFVAGELCAMEAVRAAESRRRWPAAWHDLHRKRARAWMG